MKVSDIRAGMIIDIYDKEDEILYQEIEVIYIGKLTKKIVTKYESILTLDDDYGNMVMIVADDKGSFMYNTLAFFQDNEDSFVIKYNEKYLMKKIEERM